MANWEKDLPPIARERLAKIGEPSSEERERLVESEKLDSILAQFYRGEIDAEGLWKRLKEGSKPHLLREAQIRLLDSITSGSAPDELQRKKNAILAIESLKKERNISAVELHLNSLANLQRRYKAEIDQAYSKLRAEVERNPQLRLKQVQQGQSTMVVQLTVDEAIRQIPQWRDFLSEQEKRYNQEFTKLREKLRRELG